MGVLARAYVNASMYKRLLMLCWEYVSYELRGEYSVSQVVTSCDLLFPPFHMLWKGERPPAHRGERLLAAVILCQIYRLP